VSAEPPPTTNSVEARLLALIRQELGSDSARVAGHGSESDGDPRNVVASLPDGREIIAEFSQAPKDREPLLRRLELLVSAFAHSLEAGSRRRAQLRLPPALSLRDELRALAKRSGAVDAVVIDAHSPVLWGSASGCEVPDGLSNESFETVRLLDASRAELLELLEQEAENQTAAASQAPPSARAAEADVGMARDLESTESLTVQAIDRIRELPAIQGLRRGHVLHHSHRGDDVGYSAHSFAGIYLLILVFDGAFDELRAERAVHEAIARVERLVLALPPHDPAPAPMANVLRLPRRRR